MHSRSGGLSGFSETTEGFADRDLWQVTSFGFARVVVAQRIASARNLGVSETRRDRSQLTSLELMYSAVRHLTLNFCSCSRSSYESRWNWKLPSASVCTARRAYSRDHLHNELLNAQDDGTQEKPEQNIDHRAQVRTRSSFRVTSVVVYDERRKRDPDRDRPNDELCVSPKSVYNVGVSLGRGDDCADDIAPDVREDEKSGRGSPETTPED